MSANSLIGSLNAGATSAENLPPNTSRLLRAVGIKASFDTIEDYLSVMRPPLAQSIEDCFAVVQRPVERGTASELLTVSPHNKLLHFFRDPQSPSGWAQQEVEVPEAPAGAITSIRAFYQDGVLYAVIHYPAQGTARHLVPIRRGPDGVWSRLKLQGNLRNALSKTRQTEIYRDEQGRHYLYGISHSFIRPSLFVVSQAENGSWETNYFEVVPSAQSSYRLLPGYGGSQLTVVRIEGSRIHFHGASLIDGELEWAQKEEKSFDLQRNQLTARRVIPLPGPQGHQGFLLHSDNGQLYHLRGYEQAYPSAVYLTGQQGQPSGVIAAELGYDDQDRAMIFAIDTANRQLWLLRQNGIDAAGNITFASWVCLGDSVATLGCPRNMVAGPEVFFVDTERSLRHLYQEPSDTVWHGSLLQTPLPSTEPARKSATHVLELTAINEKGAPVPQTVIDVITSRPAVLYANGLSYHCDGKAQIPLQTGLTGRITLKVIADELAAPDVCVHVSDFMAPGTTQRLRPHERMLTRMAGEEDGFTVDAQRLKKSGLVPDQVPDSVARGLAGMVRNMGKAMLTDSSPQAMRYELDLSQNGALALSTQEVERPPARTPFQGTFIGDILQWLKNAARSVIRFGVTVAEKVIGFRLQVGERVEEFVVNTLDAAASALEVLFQKLNTLFQKAVDAGKTLVNAFVALFDWQDILRTKRVIKHSVNQFLDFVGTFASGPAVPLIRDQFRVLRESWDGNVTQLQKVIGGKSFDGVIGSHLPKSGSGKLGQAMAGREVQSTYVLRQVETHQASLEPVLAAPPFPGLLQSPDFQELRARVTALGDAQPLRQQVEALYERFKQLNSAEAFFQGGIIVFLEAIKGLGDLLLTAAGDLLALVTKLVGEALNGLRTWLNKTLQVPIISDIYRSVAGSELSLCDLLALILAVPGTILYKVLKKGAAPFTEEQVQQFTSTPLPVDRIQAVLAEPPPQAAAIVSSGAAATLEIAVTSRSMKSDMAVAATSEWPPARKLYFTICNALGIVSGAAHIINSKLMPPIDLASAMTQGKAPGVALIAAGVSLVMKAMSIPWIVYVCMYETQSWTRWLKLAAFLATGVTAIIGLLLAFVPGEPGWIIGLVWSLNDGLINLGFGIATMVSSLVVDGTAASIVLGEVFNLFSALPAIMRVLFMPAGLAMLGGPVAATVGAIIGSVLTVVEELLFVASGVLLISTSARAQVEQQAQAA